VTALILATAATPIAERLAPYLGWMDKPSARKVHLRPVPLLGGAAIYVATIAAVIVFGDRSEIVQLVGILLGATLVSFCGLWDDRQPLSPFFKLAVQALAAMAIIASGIAVELLPETALNWAISFVWIVGITNAFNLLDNMDGLSGGVGAVAALFFVVLAVNSGQVLVGSLAAALLGACLGFLRYNFNPARIFMGDSGSLFIGFVLAAVGIKLRFPGDPHSVTWMIPVLVPAVPVFDTTLVTISRLRRGLNPLTTPGKDHFSHRLVALGMSHRNAVLAIYAVCIAAGIAAMLVPQLGWPTAWWVGVVFALIAGATLTWLELRYIHAHRAEAR
jgi:UDP-GlcNAc:undecaprenyl-phosphate GlcNAc-1-phosphate transferase